MKLNEIVSKRFVVRKSLIGKNAVITVNFKNGKTAKYKSYTASNNVPVVAREICE